MKCRNCPYKEYVSPSTLQNKTQFFPFYYCRKHEGIIEDIRVGECDEA